MKQLFFAKTFIIENLASSINDFEDAKMFALKNFGMENPDSDVIYTILNRKDYLKEILSGLNNPQKSLILIKGFQGTGKTSFIKTALCGLEENILNFYYLCSTITDLDDIILSLWRYLHKNSSKDNENFRSNPISAIKSIDERLFFLLKNLNRPLIITIDGFEEILQENSNNIDNELIHFFSYILSLPKIKLIISGKRLPVSTFNLKIENILDIRLSGLEENDAISFLKEHNLIAAENLLYQAFEITRGYPESLLWLITAVNVLKITPFDLIKEYFSQQASIEEFAATKIFEKISFSLRKLIWFFAVMRHPVKKSALLKLNLSENIEQDLELLVSMMILTVNNNFYYIKNPLKEMVYSLIPLNERIKTHKFIQDLYVEQISKKLEERILTISRRLLHSEQYYHYVCSMNKKHDNINHKEHYSSMISMNNDYNYISPKLSDMLLYDAASKENIANTYNIEKPENKNSLHINSPNIPGIPIVDLSHIDENLVIDLTDEEKALLANEEDQEDRKNIVSTYSESSEKFINELINKAVNLIEEKKFEIAVDNYKKVYEISQQSNDINTQAKVSQLMGNVLHQMRKYDESIEYLNESLELFSYLNDSNSINSVILNIANVYNDCYKHDIALKYYHKLLSRPEQLSEEIFINTLIRVGDIYYFREEFNQALKCYTLGLVKINKGNDQRNADMVSQKQALYFKTALIYDDLDNFDKALEFYQNTIKTNLDNNTTNYLSDAYANIANIYEELNKKNDAIDYYTRSLRVDKKLNNYEGQYKTLSILGNIYFESNDNENAYKCFYEELTISKLASEPYWTANSYLDIGDVYLSKKIYDKAIKAYIKARKTIGKTISTDSKEKIDRRFRDIIKEIGEQNFNMILENLKKKNG